MQAITRLVVFTATTLAMTLSMAGPAMADAAKYKIDPSHSYVAFKISHVGFGWMRGVFSDLDGSFTYNPQNPEENTGKFTVSIDSLDTFHAERNAHLSSDDFFAAGNFPVATFTSTRYEKTGEDTALLHGKLTIKDVTKAIAFEVTELAAKKDPWGNFRRAFSATTTIRLKDFNINFALGPASETAQITLSVEAIKQ